jgi:hypothetical protein
VREGQTERLPHHLRGGGRAQELAAPSRRAAGPAGEGRRLVEAHEPVGEARAERLDRARVLALRRGERDPAGDDDPRQVATAGESEHRRGKSLVAGGDAEHPRAPGQGADLAAHDDRGVVAIGQAVHHPRRPLRAAVAGVRAVGGERQPAGVANGFRRRAHEEADLPVARVVAEGHRTPVGLPQATVSAEDQVGRPGRLGRGPSHARVLGEAEDVAARRLPKPSCRQRHAPRGPLPARAHLSGIGVAQQLGDPWHTARHAHAGRPSRGRIALDAISGGRSAKDGERADPWGARFGQVIPRRLRSGRVRPAGSTPPDPTGPSPCPRSRSRGTRRAGWTPWGRCRPASAP